MLKPTRPSKATDTKASLLKDVTDQVEPEKRLNVNVSKSLYGQMKKHAFDENRSISEITRELWIEYLSK